MAPAASTEMIALVEELLDVEEVRKHFHEDPIGVMNAWDVDANSRDAAVLFTMSRDEIGEHTGLTQKIEAYQMESDWSEQGRDWDLPGSSPDSIPAGGEIWEDVEPFPVASVDWPNTQPDHCVVRHGPITRGGWSDPQPHGRGFRPAVFEAGSGAEKMQLTIVGEGLLGSATVHVYPRAKLDEHSCVARVGVEKVRFCNFRRVYLRTQMFDGSTWDPGLYAVRVRNHPSVCAISAGHFLVIDG